MFMQPFYFRYQSFFRNFLQDEILRSTLRNKIYKLDAAEAQSGESSSSKRRKYGIHQTSVLGLRKLKTRKKGANIRFVVAYSSHTVFSHI